MYCIPARGTTDAFAAALLRQVLERDGAQVEVSSTAELTAETLDRLQSRSVDIVCISAVPPSRFMHVRSLCKRIGGRSPALPIIAAIWTLKLDNQELADTLPSRPGLHVAASLGEARIQVREIAEAVRDRCKAGLPARVAPY